MTELGLIGRGRTLLDVGNPGANGESQHWAGRVLLILFRLAFSQIAAAQMAGQAASA
jgi:hypothetical protein